MDHADVLIVTAVKDERDAVLAAGGGEAAWQMQTGSTGLTVAFRGFEVSGGVLQVAVTQALGMGGAQAVMASAQLVRDYGVRCLAMCGVCAGKRGDVALGDVIVADRLWQYDTGKRKVTGAGAEQVVTEQGDIDMYQLTPATWKQVSSGNTMRRWPRAKRLWRSSGPSSLPPLPLSSARRASCSAA